MHDPLLGNYQLAVDYLRAGRVFNTVKYLKKLNDAAKKKNINQDQLVALGLKSYRQQWFSASHEINVAYYYLFTLIAQKEYQAANDLSDKILILNPQDDVAYALKGYLQNMYLNPNTSAISNIHHAVALNPKKPLYQYMLYQSYKTEGKQEFGF
ncbi:MAG: tetratricopeptide repeat protein [Gammaproteobacteria bacterium]